MTEKTLAEALAMRDTAIFATSAAFAAFAAFVSEDRTAALRAIAAGEFAGQVATVFRPRTAASDAFDAAFGAALDAKHEEDRANMVVIDVLYEERYATLNAIDAAKV
jgi:hypothetical protein